jgi:hypothetical protein
LQPSIFARGKNPRFAATSRMTLINAPPRSGGREGRPRTRAHRSMVLPADVVATRNMVLPADVVATRDTPPGPCTARSTGSLGFQRNTQHQLRRSRATAANTIVPSRWRIHLHLDTCQHKRDIVHLPALARHRQSQRADKAVSDGALHDVGEDKEFESARAQEHGDLATGLACGTMRG